MKMFALSCACALSVSAVSLAGDLNPPLGPVAPTMKTLDQVEPSRPINALPGAGNAVHVVSQPGAYHLTGNIVSPGAGMYAILCSASGVTIDLNGFTIAGNGTETLPAVRLSSSASAVFNGVIDDWGSMGVQTGSSATIRDIVFDNTDGAAIDSQTGVLISGCSFRFCAPLTLGSNNQIAGCVFRDMGAAIDAPGSDGVSVLDCTFDGQNTISAGATIALGDSAKLSNVSVSAEGRSALTAGDDVSIIGCLFSGIDAGASNGIRVGNSAVIKDCVVTRYGGNGIQADFGAVISGCQVSSNLGSGIVSVVSGQISGNSVYLNGGAGINGGSGALISNNLIRSNGLDGILVSGDTRVEHNVLDGDPIHATSLDNTIDSNSITDVVGNAITLDLSGNIVTRNMLSTGGINAPAGNLIGTIRTSATFGSAGPWDNFLH